MSHQIESIEQFPAESDNLPENKSPIVVPRTSKLLEMTKCPIRDQAQSSEMKNKKLFPFARHETFYTKLFALLLN